MKTENPWLVADLQEVCPGCQTCVVEDRVQMIKESTDIAWLRHVLAWRDNQITVRQAAERRLRKLQKQKEVA
jgi:hypothetical protein